MKNPVTGGVKGIHLPWHSSPQISISIFTSARKCHFSHPLQKRTKKNSFVFFFWQHRLCWISNGTPVNVHNWNWTFPWLALSAAFVLKSWIFIRVGTDRGPSSALTEKPDETSVNVRLVTGERGRRLKGGKKQTNKKKKAAARSFRLVSCQSWDEPWIKHLAAFHDPLFPPGEEKKEGGEEKKGRNKSEMRPRAFLVEETTFGRWPDRPLSFAFEPTNRVCLLLGEPRLPVGASQASSRFLHVLFELVKLVWKWFLRAARLDLGKMDEQDCLLIYRLISWLVDF